MRTAFVFVTLTPNRRAGRRGRCGAGCGRFRAWEEAVRSGASDGGMPQGRTKSRRPVPEWQQSRMTVRRAPWGTPAQAVGEVVVGEGVIPVEVVRAEDLVEPVGRLVAVPVRHLGAVTGVVEDEGVARGGPGGEPGEPVEDRLRGGAGVGQDAHVPVAGEAVPGFQRFRHLADVVDAPLQFVARIRVPVDSDQQRFLHRRSLPGPQRGCCGEKGARGEPMGFGWARRQGETGKCATGKELGE